MVYAICKRHDTEGAIEISNQVLSNLQCIIIELTAEKTRSDKIVKKKERHIQKNLERKSFKYFVSKSMIYLNMVESFYKWNRQSCTLFWLFMHSMDMYTKLRKQLEEVKFNKDHFSQGHFIYDKNFIIITPNDMIFEHDDNLNMDVNEVIEFEEDEMEDFYSWINKLPIRTGLLIGIEAKLNEVQDLFHKRCSSLYQVLNDHRKKLRQYMHTNKNNLQIYNLSGNRCLKQPGYKSRYQLLKQLLNLIYKKQKDISKYDAAYKGNRWTTD